MSTRIAVHGVAGRMGRLLLARVLDASDMALSAAWERNGHPALGRDAATLLSREPAGVVVSDDLAAWVDVILDFSLPEGSSRLMKNLIAQDRPAALVCGTTGLSPAEHELLDALSAKTAVLHAPNFSLGVNLLAILSAKRRRRFPQAMTSKSSRRTTAINKTPPAARRCCWVMPQPRLAAQPCPTMAYLPVTA